MSGRHVASRRRSPVTTPPVELAQGLGSHRAHQLGVYPGRHIAAAEGEQPDLPAPLAEPGGKRLAEHLGTPPPIAGYDHDETGTARRHFRGHRFLSGQGRAPRSARVSAARLVGACPDGVRGETRRPSGSGVGGSPVGSHGELCRARLAGRRCAQPLPAQGHPGWRVGLRARCAVRRTQRGSAGFFAGEALGDHEDDKAVESVELSHGEVAAASRAGRSRRTAAPPASRVADLGGRQRRQLHEPAISADGSAASFMSWPISAEGRAASLLRLADGRRGQPAEAGRRKGGQLLQVGQLGFCEHPELLHR